jgi:succinate dehydrogenase / fumarate reductase, cytochrome b subunit
MQNALTLTQTGIGKKALVAVTGLILFGFAVFHTLGNLQIFLGPESLNHYSELLHTIPELLWVARIVLLSAVVIHLGLALSLTGRNNGARNARYKVSRDVGDQDPLMRYARKTMVLSGPLVLFFILFHLAHLTVGAVPGLPLEHGDVYANVVHGFRNPAVAGFYIAANVFLGLHLYQGGHSLLQSLGLRSERYGAQVKAGAAAVALFVAGGNVIMPIAVMLRLIGASVD